VAREGDARVDANGDAQRRVVIDWWERLGVGAMMRCAAGSRRFLGPDSSGRSERKGRVT
jgi:hypothetical protein